MAGDWAGLLRPAVRRVIDAMLGGATTLTEIAQATGFSKPTLVGRLKELSALGIVQGERVPTATGSEARYRLLDASLHLSISSSGPTAISWATPGAWTSEFPLVSQLPQEDVRAEAVHFLRELASRVPPDAGLVVVAFGSAVRGEATWKSDIDLLVLAPHVDGATKKALDEAVFATELTSKHAVSAILLARDEWPSSRKRIVEDAREEGAVLWAQRGEDAPWSTMKRYRGISI